MLKRFLLGNPADYNRNVLNTILILAMVIAVASVGTLGLSFVILAEISPDHEAPSKVFFGVLIALMILSIAGPVILLAIGNIQTFKSDWRWIKTGQEA